MLSQRKVVQKKEWLSASVLGLIAIMLLVNLFALITASFKPAGIGRVNLMQTITELSKGDNAEVNYVDKTNIYAPWGGAPARFYLNDEITLRKIDLFEQANDSLHCSTDQSFIILKKQHLLETAIEPELEALGYVKVDESIPYLFQYFLKIYGAKTKEILVLFHKNCE